MSSTRPKDAVAKDLEAQFLPKDKVIHTYTPAVINTGSKLVAIDTGLGLGTYAQSKGALGQYQANLKAAGIDANNIDVVIISHFHGDHINGLIGPDNKPMFPNAEIMVPETEWAFWMDESNVSKLPEPAKGQIKNPAAGVRSTRQQSDEVPRQERTCARNYFRVYPRSHARTPLAHCLVRQQYAARSGGCHSRCRHTLRAQSGLAIRV